jgi:MOSC domain-containing protein YiiM
VPSPDAILATVSTSGQEHAPGSARSPAPGATGAPGATAAGLASVPDGVVVGVHRSARHGITKATEASITLLTGLGVEGDAHAGETVQHRYQARKDPTRTNLRQVHLIPTELLDELADQGHPVAPGQLGENVTTSGLDLQALPTGARLHLGPDAVVELTGLRTPCRLIDRVAPGVMSRLIDRDDEGRVVRRAGVMSIVVTGGVVHPGDAIRVGLPAGPVPPLEPV